MVRELKSLISPLSCLLEFIVLFGLSNEHWQPLQFDSIAIAYAIFFHCPIGKFIAIDCCIDPGLSDARLVVSVLPEKLPGEITSWQSADHHKPAYQAVGNQPLGNQPKTFRQSAILQTHLVTPMWSAISRKRIQAISTILLSQLTWSYNVGVNQWLAISHKRI